MSAPRDGSYGLGDLPANKNYLKLDDSDGDLAKWLDAKGASAVLVRPDFYVFGTAASAQEAIALVRDLIDKVTFRRASASRAETTI
jgi:hypothetical protein